MASEQRASSHSQADHRVSTESRSVLSERSIRQELKALAPDFPFVRDLNTARTGGGALSSQELKTLAPDFPFVRDLNAARTGGGSLSSQELKALAPDSSFVRDLSEGSYSRRILVQSIAKGVSC